MKGQKQKRRFGSLVNEFSQSEPPPERNAFPLFPFEVISG